MNISIFSGNVGRDSELRYTSSGTAQATFSLAVNQSRKKPDGTWDENTLWVNCVLWAEKAERQSQYITKGTPATVQGRIQERSWQSDDGVKHSRWELICDKVELHGKREKTGGAQGGGSESGQEDLPWD